MAKNGKDLRSLTKCCGGEVDGESPRDSELLTDQAKYEISIL